MNPGTGIDLVSIHDFVAALFCGAFIGMQREHGRDHRTPAPDAAPSPAAEAGNLAGIRTHTLVALLGALARLVDREAGRTSWFAGLGFALVALFAIVAHGVRATRTGHYGMTSVPTLMLTYGLGVLCLAGQRPLAVGLAVVITGILAVKVPLHSFVRRLSGGEIAAAVKFALLALVLLPLLPDSDFGPADWPWLAARLHGMGASEAALQQLRIVNPHQVWLLVVAISGLGFVGYVLVRVLGAGRGFLLTGFAGGLVSSTSVTLAMAAQSRRSPDLKGPIAAAVLAACTVMALRVLVVAVALHGALLVPLGVPLGALTAASLAATIWLSRRGGKAPADRAFQVDTPLALWPALKLTGLMFLVRVLSEVAVLALGSVGLIVMAALSGIVDVDAINVAASQQAAASQVTTTLAVAAICTAVAVNTLAKGILLLATGDRATGRTTFVALLLTLGVGAVAYAIAAFAPGGA